MKILQKSGLFYGLKIFASSTLGTILLYLLLAFLSLEIVFAQTPSTSSIQLKSNQKLNSTSFQSLTALGSIGNYVWKDKNNNGLQDANEFGVAGVILELYQLDANGNTPASPLAKDTTDISGKYLFQGLPTGSYKVKIVASSVPANCQITPQLRNGDGTNDSDFDANTNFSLIVTIDTNDATKTNVLTVDAGLVNGCLPSRCIQISARIVH